MALEKIIRITGRAVALPGNDIDTDRIIPARFLKCVTFDGLGAGLFADERKAAAQAGRVHPLDDPRFAGAGILLSGVNFGCGSSREHAPQAIRRSGFRAVVAESYAEIFFGNATTIGLPCVSVARADLRRLEAAVAANPGVELTVDLEERNIRCGGETLPLTIRETAREALTQGRWDTLGELLEGLPRARATAASLPYMAPTA